MDTPSPHSPQPQSPGEEGLFDDWASPSLQEGEMSMISDTVASAVRAVDGMRSVLEDLNNSIIKAQKSRSFESRLGRLFLEAQDFLDHVGVEATEWANRTVANAKAEAAEIVRVAHEQAARIVEEARRSSVSAEAVQSIQTTIETFNRANAELVRELARLNEALTPPSPQAAGEGDQQVHLNDEAASQGVDEQTNSSMGGAEPLWPQEAEREPFFGPKVRRWPAVGFLGH